MNRSVERAWQRIPRMGMLALAAFVVCAATGVMLVPAYRPGSALDSLALMSLKNPAGSFVRSLHYWSAQGFLALTAGHVVEHLLRRSEARLRFGRWLRLALLIPVIVAAMLSGFLLRADAAAAQALPVLRSLLDATPLIGAGLRRMLTGSGADLSTLYLHHACTATVLIWLVTVEHARHILPTARALWGTIPAIAGLSVALAPALEWRAAGVEKGPWYLVGLQEFLHWLPRPQVAIWLGAAALTVLILLPRMPWPLAQVSRWSLGTAAVLYVALTVVGLLFRGDGWWWMSPSRVLAGEVEFASARAYLAPARALVEGKVPLVDGRREGCLSCHGGMTGFVAAHDPKTIGCASCHLGDPWTLDKKLAHAGMTRTPGNLSIAAQTCGASNCHTDQAQRMQMALMNTMSGVAAVDKAAFGESGDLDAHFDVAALKNSPADTHLRQLCASCHLGQDKVHPAAVDESGRGGGCSACHLHYDGAAAGELQKRGPGSTPLHHPEISIRVRSEACFGCHSRSGRIATNYEGWHETLKDAKEAQSSPGWLARFRVLADERVFERRSADVHAEKGMTCVECHVAQEVMGDGAAHAHEGDAIRIACADCHRAGATAAREPGPMDAETEQIAAMRRLNEPGRRFVIAERGGTYPNVYLNARGRPELKLMNSAGVLEAKPMGPECAQDFHRRLDCAACHTAWAPQCVSCHTSFDPKAQGWDHLDRKDVDGAWQEEGRDYLSDAPALGVERRAGADGRAAERVTTFAPGMILRLDVAEGGGHRREHFRRLFAPVSAHTTATRARDCRSCHDNAAALGYGRGDLKYVVAGRRAEWQFTPQFARSAEDGLPADAWIGFLQQPEGDHSTRKGARPFTLDEQRRILLVGACLECHEAKDRRLGPVFADFKHYRSRISPRCILPERQFALSNDRGSSL